MGEQLQPKDFQIDPMRMSILEGGWINAISRGDHEDFFKYQTEGLVVQYRLNRADAEKAADFITAFLWTKDDIDEKEVYLLNYHKVLSQGSGFGFDPSLATKIYMEMEKNGFATTAQACRYHSLLHGGKLSGEDLWPIWESRTQVFSKYDSVKNDPNASVSDHNKAWVELTAGLLDFYTGLNKVLMGSLSSSQ